MADTKSYAITRAERIKQPDEGLDVLRLWYNLDDGTTGFMELDGSTLVTADAATDGGTIDSAFVPLHSGGPIMFSGSYDLTNTVVP